MSLEPQNASICPANGWFYTATGTQGEPIVFPVAVWTHDDKGNVIGLISVANPAGNNAVPYLVYPPPIGGHYRHEWQLTAAQLEAVRTGHG